MPYQAVIFDLDGTLLDTLEDIADSVNRVLEKNQYPVHDLERFKRMVGLGLEQLLFDALPESARDAARVRSMTAEAGEEYAARWQNKTRPYPGVVETLGRLKAKGLKIGVLSNKPERFTRLCVERLLPPDTAEAVLGAREGRPNKPAPDGALQISKMWGIPPRQILYVGDSGVDMRTAKAAGMFAVGVSWGFRSVGELRQNGADAVVHRPEELMNLVDLKGQG